jgi:hypothetical protein
LRAARPILGLADPAGDTGQALQSSGVEYIAALEDANAIAAVIGRYVDDLRRGNATIPDGSTMQTASRRDRTAQLAGLVNETVV